MIHGHGGNADILARRLGRSVDDIFDLSCNINPLGPVPELMDYLRSALGQIHRLPEPDAGAAVAAQAGVLGVSPSRLVAGNGTTELIYTLPRALNTRRALIVGPTYADYADACRMAGAHVCHWTARTGTGFRIDPNRLLDKARVADTVFWCNPNNPTGVWTPTDELAGICKACPDTRFVVDESYLGFRSDGDSMSLISCRLPNAVVLLSLSKMDALAGLRIGFAVAPPDLARAMRRIAVPWTMNRLAQSVVVYLADHPAAVAAHRSATRDHLARVRPALMAALAMVMPVVWTESETTFILGRLNSEAETASLVSALAGQGILIRHCGNFFGLSGRYFRISLKTEPVHAKLMDAVADIRLRHDLSFHSSR